MRTLFWIAVIASVACIAVALTDLERWKEFKKTYEKSYPDPAEDAYHYAIFRRSLKEVNEHNAKYAAGEVNYHKVLIKYSDLPKNQWAYN